MALAVPSVKEEREHAWIHAKEGFPPDVVLRIMKGLPVEGADAEKVRAMRQAWSRYHECL